MVRLLPEHSLFPALPCAALFLVVLGGCSHPLEVDVPASVHGRVTVLCDSFTSTAAPVHVDEEGMARHAACPQTQAPLVVMRGGQPVKPLQTPHWSSTGDGILLSVEFDLP